MIKKLIEYLKKLKVLTTSYSINIFDNPLSEKEENETIDKYLKGDKEARNKLIKHNLRLVAHIVKKYENNITSQDDLISIGTIGLIKGIDSYKPSKGVKLTTYAAKCAENEILMHFRSNKKYQNNISLNETIAHDKEGYPISLIDVLKSETIDFENIIETEDNIKNLNKYLKCLNKRELEIIKMRYGLFNTKELTQKEIAKHLNISRSYVSRIEKRALIKMLRKFIQNNNY